MLGLLQLTQSIIEKGLCMHVPAQGQKYSIVQPCRGQVHQIEASRQYRLSQTLQT